MSSTENLKGAVYRCPVCGAEIILLAPRIGAFGPRCCNQDMMRQTRKVSFYACPVCGAEIGVLMKGPGHFAPRCCLTDMVLKVA